MDEIIAGLLVLALLLNANRPRPIGALIAAGVMRLWAKLHEWRTDRAWVRGQTW